MNKVVLIVLILCVILSMVRVEKFSNSPSDDINDEEVDMSMYKKMEDADITKDLMQEMVLRRTAPRGCRRQTDPAPRRR